MTTPTPTSTGAPRERRNQAQRSAATREALLDATLECLMHDGYASLTTARVAERAGMSRGAHLHHFQTRGALVAAAMEHLARRREEALRSATRRLPQGPERVEKGLDLLWRVYANPLYQAVLDLWSAARTDPELRVPLSAIERDLDRDTLELGRLMFPEAARRPDFEEVMGLVVATIRGLALLDTLAPEEARNAREWPHVRRRLSALLRAGADS